MAASPKKLLVLAFTSLAACVSSVACTSDPPATTTVDPADDPTLLAEDGTDAATAETDTEIVTSSLVSASTAAGSLALQSSDLGGGDIGTAGIGDGAKAIFFPKGCLDVTSDVAAKKITYVFTSCIGPNGIYKINGTLTATYAYGSGTLVLDLVGTNLVLNRSTIDWTAHAEVTASGAARTMTWHGALSGTTARGRDFSRTNDKTVSWSFGAKCYAVSGVSEGNVKDRYVKTEVTGYSRCAGACPAAGGSITVSNANDTVQVEILFDGTSTATYSTSKGTTSFDLACGA
jgi:hypothetical protein